MFESPSNPKPSDNRTSSSETEIRTADDTAMFTRIGQRDENAMEAVFRRYSGPVYSVAFRVLRDSGQAEDVLQEVFLQLWRKPAAFVQNRGSLGAWLVVIARNRAIDVLRRRKPSSSVEDVVLTSVFHHCLGIYPWMKPSEDEGLARRKAKKDSERGKGPGRRLCITTE